MKQIALTPITLAVPKGISPEAARLIQKAEETMRENNMLIEHALNEIIKEINNGNVSE